MLLIGGLVGAALLIGVIALFFLLRDSESPEAPAEPSPVAADTATVSEPSTPERPPANLTLGDTLHLAIVAEGDVLGVRVQRDDDLRRPYWIDAGQAAVFPFRSRIVVEQQLDSLRLILEGHPYPFSPTSERVVISRDTVEAFADTLRGRPASLPASRDTLDLVPDP